MTLWLPLLNYGRSYAPLVNKITAVTGPSPCVQGLALGNAQVAALMFHGKMNLRLAGPADPHCPWLMLDSTQMATHADQLHAWGWQEITRLRRPTDNNETLVIFAPRKS